MAEDSAMGEPQFGVRDHEAGALGDEAIRYRRWGGMAGLDQDLTVSADGRALLRDRRSRATSEISLTDSELDRLRSLVAEAPAESWHGLAGGLARRAIPRPNAMRFRIARGRRRIEGAAGVGEAATTLAPLIAGLDEILARCVREGRDESG